LSVFEFEAVTLNIYATNQYNKNSKVYYMKLYTSIKKDAVIQILELSTSCIVVVTAQMLNGSDACMQDDNSIYYCLLPTVYIFI